MNLNFYWINLDRDIGRRDYMENLFKNNNIKNIRVPAILGTSAQYSKEVACTNSHLKAIKTFLDTDTNDVGIICEDDLSFEYKQYWKTSLEDVIANAPKDWEIIQLGLITNKLGPEFYKNDTNYLVHEPGYWSCICYLINKKGANHMQNIKIDTKNHHNYVADLKLYSHCKTYTYKYTMFTFRDNNDSTIHADHLSKHLDSKVRMNKFIMNQK